MGGGVREARSGGAGEGEGERSEEEEVDESDPHKLIVAR